MQFRTEIEIEHSPIEIDHTTQIQIYGSCFATSIGRKLQDSKFRIDLNPFGVIYNPLSISTAIRRMVGESVPDNDLIVCRDDQYFSLLHHSDFRASSAAQLSEICRERASFSKAYLLNADHLIVTFGTAYVYIEKVSGTVVSNCHKLASTYFLRKRLLIEEIVDDWSSLLTLLSELNPGLKVLFTVSPIRHWKDGAHDNQLSKSILLLAVDDLCRRFSMCSYFPAYELMMDDLRDYRFYAEEMNHPSDVAVSYIWERFSSTFFSKSTIETCNEWNKIRNAINHRPFSPHSPHYLEFRDSTHKRLLDFTKHHPEIDMKDEISRFIS